MATIGRVLLMEKGDYSGSTAYNKLDWVRNNGAAWVCKVDNTIGVAPPTLPTTSNANWQLLAADGNVSGSVAWNSVTNKPFTTLDSNDFKVESDVLKLKNGGGGSTTFAGLTDVSVSSPVSGQIVRYKKVGNELKLSNVNMPTGGHEMLPEPAAGVDEDDVVSEVNDALLEGGINDNVPSLYGMGVWTNTDCIQIMAEVDQGDDGLGTWLDTGWESGNRSGWLWDESLYQILVDGDNNRRYDIHIEPIFDVADSETVSLYAWRIDDDVTISNTHGGAIAFKFNGEIQSAHAYIGVKMTKLRTKYKVVTPLP